MCWSQMASTRQHNKSLVSGTIGAFRLEKKPTLRTPSPQGPSANIWGGVKPASKPEESPPPSPRGTRAPLRGSRCSFRLGLTLEISGIPRVASLRLFSASCCFWFRFQIGIPALWCRLAFQWAGVTREGWLPLSRTWDAAGSY